MLIFRSVCFGDCLNVAKMGLHQTVLRTSLIKTHYTLSHQSILQQFSASIPQHLSSITRMSSSWWVKMAAEALHTGMHHRRHSSVTSVVFLKTCTLLAGQLPIVWLIYWSRPMITPLFWLSLGSCQAKHGGTGIMPEYIKHMTDQAYSLLVSWLPSMKPKPQECPTIWKWPKHSSLLSTRFKCLLAGQGNHYQHYCSNVC